MFVKQWLCFHNMFSQKYSCEIPGILGKNYMELLNLRKVHRKKYFLKKQRGDQEKTNAKGLKYP